MHENLIRIYMYIYGDRRPNIFWTLLDRCGHNKKMFSACRQRNYEYDKVCTGEIKDEGGDDGVVEYFT